ncbi:hypothetical protein FNW02_17975 [Komarekiella sp. 'clone 1']|uniref:Uncharacterized protein n=1 Tax=Komarekiella delphini-convector SJRDD-AB1 TaxID=2593771 RepID=A0AA40SZ18_9NOST|nr:hypothetical protein [Komarekiella delphini-convector]MBD6617664.1 hypothetical protein [Komarekiella delphini-convector SJRDD-AB1]
MTIIWKFSTHPRLKDSNGLWNVYWVSDRELETNIKTLYQTEPNADAEFWARLFVNTFDCEPLALRHMSAYLEKLGYRAANKVYRELNNFQHYTQLKYDQHDIWQIAWLFSSTPDIFFSNFNSQLPLENYAYIKMEGKIKDEIVRNLGMQKRRSDWGLLRYSTRTYLQEALQNQGYKQPQLSCYLLAWDSFKEIYAPQRVTGGRSLPAPTDEQLHMMANLYNKLVQSPQVAALGKANQAKIQAWLNECIQALRTYQTKHLISLDSPTGGNEDSAVLSEMILNGASESQWEQIEIQEPAFALTAILTELLTRIDSDTDNCLLLIYGFALDYRSIAPIFEIYYTTVRNRYNQAMQQLLKQVAQWAQEKLGVTPDSESLNEMQSPLKECLKKYYKSLIFQSVFRTAWEQLDDQRRNILHLRYFRQMDEAAIARQLQLCELEVSNKVVTGREELATAIKEWIQNRLNILPDLLNPRTDKIVTLVQRLIANFPDPDFV